MHFADTTEHARVSPDWLTSTTFSQRAGDIIVAQQPEEKFVHGACGETLDVPGPYVVADAAKES
jgi:hypothetical protein